MARHLASQYAPTATPSASACELMCQPSASSAIELYIHPPTIDGADSDDLDAALRVMRSYLK